MVLDFLVEQKLCVSWGSAVERKRPSFHALGGTGPLTQVGQKLNPGGNEVD